MHAFEKKTVNAALQGAGFRQMVYALNGRQLVTSVHAETEQEIQF